ncbi:MAG: hypothetical protein DLM61_24345 [Pseudonocardiales bacterium]|nr:MAG: hypothetical protein DLM61_24345 [Pseudonocardiales bacterium]
MTEDEDMGTQVEPEPAAVAPDEDLPAGIAPEDAVEGARDAAFWAKRVTTLKRPDAPADAINLNVEGKRLASPIKGFGKMWQKTYQVPLSGETVSPTDLIAPWKERFPEFWPKGNSFYGPLTGIAPGEVALLNMTLPGRVKLSTGVLVLYADEESFTLMTPQGHMFAGWITFSAARRAGVTVAQTQVLMRASDPMYEIGLTLGGHRQEDRFWEHTLSALAAAFGEEAEVDTQVVCIDNKRQWRHARNIWHSAAIRSALYIASAPVRLLKKAVRRSGTQA